MYWCGGVSVPTRWFPDDNSRRLTPRIMKLHRYIDHDRQMTPIDFQVTSSRILDAEQRAEFLDVTTCPLGSRILDAEQRAGLIVRLRTSITCLEAKSSVTSCSLPVTAMDRLTGCFLPVYTAAFLQS
ncbi:hypothetical protein DPMN_143998 [Dreissena polymorpha]|uniref:Uncharacterized protein n=1 Tax=Dreissena polymorpha TaxID=45954 RepID=A0A9D4GI33_DREPO|nr:hypothetical protein DPMN_143998 [Dreissena polymorpha]